MNTASYQQISLMEIRRYTLNRETRKEQMLTVIREWGRGGLTHRQIAKLCNMKKSPYTRDILIDLLDDGLIVCDTAIATNQREVFVFFPRS